MGNIFSQHSANKVYLRICQSNFIFSGLPILDYRVLDKFSLTFFWGGRCLWKGKKNIFRGTKHSNRARKARKDTMEFLVQVEGFIEKRNELNKLANEVLPRGLANRYSNFPTKKKELKQDRGNNETLAKIKLDSKLAKALMDRISNPF